MTMAGDESDGIDVLRKRGDILDRLCDGSATKGDMVEELDVPRSTLDRAIRELEAIDLVERRGSRVSATVAGRLAADTLDSFRTTVSDVLAAEAVLDPLTLDAPVARQVVAGSEALLADDPVPHGPLERFHDALADAERYRAVLPALDDPRHVRLLYEHVVTSGKPAELIVDPELLEGLRTEFPRRMAMLAESEAFDLRVGDVPPFALAIVEDSAGETTVFVMVFTEPGSGVHGVLINDATPASRWANDLYAERRAGAAERTDELSPDPDGGGVIDAADGGTRSALGRALPSALERQGFVRPSTSYFRAEPVADPTTAWRAGLSLPEVHTGYAVDRTPSVDDTDEADTGSMAAALVDDLTDGTDCVVLGPPGSGKSTVCKQVACEWYDADHGTVLYREQGRGRSFQSVEDLLVAVEAEAGHTLVVVEDAARPETGAIFEAIRRLDDREDVSFLLDSRESEWDEPPGNRVDVHTLRARYLPQFEEGDARRLVEHFEQTVGESVDVPVDRLWADVRDAAADGAAPNEMLLLLHRLATYADPVTDEQTSLETAVAAVYDDLAGEETALDVAVLANVLNTAGIEVTPGTLYAVAEPGAFEAVDRALADLEGRVLFAREDGTYRTVHESWSIAFLEHLLDVEGNAAAERFGDCVSSLLALADAPDDRDAIDSHLDGSVTPDALTDEPGAWADETVETVYALGRNRPKLAPLFGDADNVTLPKACSAATSNKQHAWLGRMFRNGGDYDRAEQAFERLPEEGNGAVERLLGLAQVASGRGEYDDAAATAEACSKRLADTDRDHDRARARLILGRATFHRNDFETAEPHLKAALDGFEATGDRRRVAETLTVLGNNANRQGEYGHAHEYHEEALEIEREIGDRRGEAQTLTNLGLVTFREGDYDRAREYFQHSLDLAQTLGNSQGEATNLNNLAGVEHQQGNHDRAREYYERSLQIREEIGDVRGQAQCLVNLGIFPEQAGDLEQAREYYERALEKFRELEHPWGQSESLAHLGNPVRKQGGFEQAREYHEESLQIRRELGSKDSEAKSLANLGRVARNQGRYDDARQYHEQGLEIAREIGHRWSEVKTLGELGELARLRGEFEQARERHDEALELATAMGESAFIAQISRRLGELARVQGEYDRASDHYRTALQTVEDTGDQFAKTLIRLAQARLAVERGDTDRGHELADDVRQGFAAMGATPWVARSHHLLGRVAAETGDIGTARDHWQTALNAFESVGAPQDALATLRELVASCETDDKRVSEWIERAAGLLDDAPEPVVEAHREWVESYRDSE